MFQHGEMEHAFRNPAYVMKIHGRTHQRPGNEKRLGGIDSILVQHNPFRCVEDVTDQAVGINGAIRGAGIIGIPEQVVHPVHIKIAMEDPREGMRTFNDGTKFGWIDSRSMQECPEPLLHNRLNLVMGPVQQRFHKRLTRMGERTMPDIMEQGSSDNEPALCIGEPEPAADDIREVHRPQRVLEPGMGCTGIDEIRETQLADIPEAL